MIHVIELYDKSLWLNYITWLNQKINLWLHLSSFHLPEPLMVGWCLASLDRLQKVDLEILKTDFKDWWGHNKSDFVPLRDSSDYGFKLSHQSFPFCDILPRFVLMMIVFGTENPSSLWAWFEQILKYYQLGGVLDKSSQ